jgi:hypothetical protein
VLPIEPPLPFDGRLVSGIPLTRSVSPNNRFLNKAPSGQTRFDDSGCASRGFRSSFAGSRSWSLHSFH